MPDLNSAYTWAINTCNASDVGYSQNYRNQRTVNGITYYDCSSFIWYSLLSGGFDVTGAYLTALGYAYSGNAITTANERAWLSALGFVQQPISGEWLPGDILWRSGHTEMVYEGGTGQGRTMGAHSSSVPLPNQVSINTSVSTASSWTSLWRYGSGGATEGISIFVIAAIAGNWCAESNINPGRWEGGVVAGFESLNHGYGLGQWTNTGGDTHGRLYQMHVWLQNNGYSDDSGEGQCQYFLYENVWRQTVTIGGTTYTSPYATLSDYLHSTSTDLETLVREFTLHWEGIYGDQTARYNYAQQIFTYLQEHGNDTSITSWVSGNRYLTWSEIYNNAVMLFRFLGSGGGGGGTSVKSKMPLWMMCRPWWLI